MRRNKRWDLCREFECPHPTRSGKKEPDLEKRHCHYHSPEAFARRQDFIDKHATRAPDKPVKAQLNPFFLPLVCVFRPYEVMVDHHSDGSRVCFTKTAICGALAPRRPSRRSLPRYPNRFGDPLCEEHSHYARDERAFPGDVTEVLRDEAEVKRQEALSVLKNMMARGAGELTSLRAAGLLASNMRSKAPDQSIVTRLEHQHEVRS